MEEMPTFITQHRDSAGQQSFTTSADPQRLQGKQLQIYDLVLEHAKAPPLRLIVSGTAGTGKSYFKTSLYSSFTRSSTYGRGRLQGYTLHSLLSLPVKGYFRE